MSSWKHVLGLGLVSLAMVAMWHVATPAQPGGQKPELRPAAAGAKFHFEVLESFDAKYLGDTPGHSGRGGGLEGSRPNVSLGDAVHRGEEKVGHVTSVLWDRARGSLTIEFDPEPLIRVSVGDEVWVALAPAKTADKGGR